MSYRSLNGIYGSGGSSANNLLRTNNLSDLTNVPVARTNLGLTGSLDVATSPYISITSPFNGTSNQQISLNVTATGGQNKLAAYDDDGLIFLAGANNTGQGIDGGFHNEFNLPVNTDSLTITPSGAEFSALRMQTNTATFDLINTPQGSPVAPGTLPNKCFVLWSEDNNNFCFHVDGDSGDFVVRGAVRTSQLQTNSITTSSGDDLNFSSKNILSINNLEANSLKSYGNVITNSITTSYGDDLNFNSKNILSINNLEANSLKSYGNVIGTTIQTGKVVVGGVDTIIIDEYDQVEFIANGVMIETLRTPWGVLNFDGNDVDVINNASMNQLRTNSITTLSGSNISFNNSNIISVGNISLTTLTVNTITSPGTYISFSDKNVGNIDNLTINLDQTIGLTTFCSSLNVLENADTQTDYTYSFNFHKNHFTNVGNISCRNIDVNNYKINNIANITKQLWAYTNMTTNTSTSITSIPAASQPVMTIITGSSTNYTFRTSVGFTYNGEKELRFKYAIQPITSSSGVFLTLGVYDYNGTTLLLSVSGTPQNSTATIPGSLSITLTGLTIGTNYQVCWMDKSGTGGITYNLFCPEISLSY